MVRGGLGWSKPQRKLVVVVKSDVEVGWDGIDALMHVARVQLLTWHCF
jgi:hypothetical protein